jgi:hypothetical protein
MNVFFWLFFLILYAVFKVLYRTLTFSILTLYRDGAEGSLRVFGGGKRTRTADILLAKQALYQLSYTPFFGNHEVGTMNFIHISYFSLHTF